MKRFSAIVLAVAVLLGTGLAAPQTEPVADANPNINALAAQRIELLQERVDHIEALIKHRVIGSTALIEPTIDLINAKLDYAKSNDERRSLYDEMLKQYDRLIELAELGEKRGTREMQIQTREDSLYLKSERLRIRIERESFN